jgi:hypothetical protein
MIIDIVRFDSRATPRRSWAGPCLLGGRRLDAENFTGKPDCSFEPEKAGSFTYIELRMVILSLRQRVGRR